MKLFVGILIAICIFFASQNKLAGAEAPVTCKDTATGSELTGAHINRRPNMTFLQIPR